MKAVISFGIGFVVAVVMVAAATAVGRSYTPSRDVMGDGLFTVAENVTGATVTAPVTCAAGTFGHVVAVNDTDDTAVTGLCYCGQQADDSTYDWLEMDNTACPFF